jgi:hypothetical protein
MSLVPLSPVSPKHRERDREEKHDRYGNDSHAACIDPFFILQQLFIPVAVFYETPEFLQRVWF